MLHQIRSEWVKLRSVRSSVMLLATGLLLAVGVGALVGARSSDDFDVSNALIGVMIAQLLFAALGVQVVGQEYRFNTIRPTFSINPRRGQVIAAKAVVVLTTVAVAAAAMVGLALAAADVAGGIAGHDLDLSVAGTGRIVLGSWLGAVASTAFGFGVGSIVRQPIAGIMVALTWVTVAESLLGALVQRTAKWLPFLASANLTNVEIDPDILSPMWGGVYMFGVFATMMVIGASIIRRTDA